ncbi:MULTISPECIES: TM2 domain-containing protein [unclassified Streptomyces]|uniref:TM2 domain-containing protein n=1 Tax=unclassified Streptomyces TaxID=2593676 RepID=UPI00225093D7|nr:MULTISPECIES: TM2 domain-containing protein [unclassified Streptomyces]MCX4971940.1 NINE protein [Streptomyces sp. NBC_00620]WRZ20245.1 NINE protein [Streptomyces sp. NBC_00243]
MTEQPQPPEQPQQPSDQPPGYGYPNPGPVPPDGANPYGAGQAGAYQQPGPGAYQQPGGYQQPGPYGYPQQGYPMGAVPPGMYTGDPNAPYGYDPYGRPYSDKSKIVAGILQLTLGSLGIGRFYIGSVGIGIAQLFTCGGLGIWALIDGILLLTGNTATDSQGRILRG